MFRGCKFLAGVAVLRAVWLAVAGALALAAPAAAQTAVLSAAPTALSPSGGQVTFTLTTTYTGAPAVFTLLVASPAGWTYVSGIGEPVIKPTPGGQAASGSPLSWTDISRLTSPVQFSFVLSYPAGTTSATITSAVVLRQSVNVVVVDKATGAQTTEVREVRTDLTPTPVALGTAPVITTAPTTQILAAGSVATLSVAASGSAPLAYAWRKDGATLAGATAATLAFPSFQSANVGSYTVVVTNPFGSVTSSSAVLTLTPTIPSGGGGGGFGGGGGGSGGGAVSPIAPSLTTQPVAVTTTTGGTATFAVIADGTAPFTYQWRRNTVAISGATAATFSLASVTAADAGAYSVVVTNAAGSVTSAAATLTVTPAPAAPTITAGPVAQTVDEGQSATFTVTTSGTAPFTYQWRKNGVALSGATNATFALARVTAADAGTYSVVVTNAVGSLTSTGAALTVRPPVPVSFTGTYFGTFAAGGSFALHVRANLTAVFLGYATNTQTTFIARDVSVDAAGRVRFTVTITTASAERIAAAAQDYTVDATISSAGTLTGSVANAGGTTSTALTATRSAATGPAQAVAGFYSAGAANSAATSYAIVSPTGQTFVLAVSPTATEAGTGTVDATGRLAVTTISGASVSGTLAATTSTLTTSLTTSAGAKTDFVGGSDTRVATEKLLNIATRGAVGGTAGAMIAGFVIRGDAPKLVLIRAVGPGLAAFGVAGALTAPRLELFNAAGVSLGLNTGWGSVPDIASAAGRAGAFALAAGSNDAALLVALTPGAYTAVVSGEAGAAGVALVEVYDVSENATPAQKVVNIASRGAAGSGDNTLTAGFVISGTVPKRVLIRGVGPTLGAFGVPGTLADPQLTLYTQAGTVIATNDNWSTPVTPAAADATQLSAAAASVGAFAYTPASKDAALLLYLAPGPYTVQVGGVAATTGAALVEVYEVP